MGAITILGLPFTEPLMKPLSTSGQFQAGCYLVFMSAGVLATVYQDPELKWPFNLTSIPGSGPAYEDAVISGLMADATGRFPAIWLDPAVEYAYTLYSAAGAVLETWTNVNAANTPIAAVAVKTSATSRANTTTLTNDPDLQISVAQAGTYRVELDLVFFPVASTVNFMVAFSGTASVTDTLAIFGDLGSGTPFQSDTSVNIPFGSSTISSGVADNAIRIVGTIQVSTPGVISLQWAQGTASATEITSVSAGSTLTVQQLI